MVVIYLSLLNYCDRPFQDNVFHELLGLVRTVPLGTFSSQEYACRTTQDILQATRAGMTMLFVQHCCHVHKIPRSAYLQDSLVLSIDDNYTGIKWNAYIK